MFKAITSEPDVVHITSDQPFFVETGAMPWNDCQEYEDRITALIDPSISVHQKAQLVCNCLRILGDESVVLTMDSMGGPVTCANAPSLSQDDCNQS